MPPVDPALPWFRISRDGRTRSSRGSSDDSEELREDGWIDEDLRAGGPTLAPAPSTTISLPPESPYNSRLDGRGELSKQLRTILEEAGVTAKAFTFCYRQCPLFLDDELIPTLIIDAKRKSPDDKWLSASKEIYELLKENDLSYFNVEIYDERLDTPKYSTPVPSSDPIYPLWDEILNQILNGIDCRSVLAIECFRYGENFDGDKNPVTVIITVDRTSNGPWKDTREIIISILSRHSLHHVAVLISQGQIYRSADSLDRRLPENAWEDPMQVGLSLGVYQSRHSSSTFGGWVELKHEEGSDWKRLGLTCFHCVLPNLSDLSLDDKIAIRKTFFKGISINDPISKRLLSLEQPSLKDARHAFDNLAKDLHRPVESRIIAIREVIQEGGGISPRSRRPYDYYTARLAAISETMTKIEKFHQSPPPVSPCNNLLVSCLPINPRMELESMETHSPSYAGYVFAASGYRQMTSTIRGNKVQADWALIEVPESRHSENTLLTYGDVGLYNDLQPFPGVPEEREKVLKLGRSTEKTKGYFSGLKSALLNVYDGKGGMSEVKTLEYAVTGASGTLFSDPGDSGALVFDEGANCIGMIFAGSTTSKASYVTLLPDLYDDIKRITGAVDVRIAE
ncbi:hypothetical protein FQN49_005716 [Arthroderma sp. PD_2]|nr:hypothetical protein FQN49_005716 [Arthroderma sp. PD_2]